MRCLEPGYYHDGEFGIRIESLVVVKDAKTQVNFSTVDMNTFLCDHGDITVRSMTYDIFAARVRRQGLLDFRAHHSRSHPN